DGIRDFHVTGVQTCALPIYPVDRLTHEVRHPTPQPTDPVNRVLDPALQGVKSAGEAVEHVGLDPVPHRPERRLQGVPRSLSAVRSEERRVGKEGSTAWPPYA